MNFHNSHHHNQGSRQGIYRHNSSFVNGKPSWTLNSSAIWYVIEYNVWAIGNLEDIGTAIGAIISGDSTFWCPFDMPSEYWKYYYMSAWINAGGNGIKIECLGKFQNYQQELL